MKRYRFDDSKGGTRASLLQITRNYANAAKSSGGEVLYEGKCDAEGMTGKSCDRMATLRLTKGEKEIWIEIIPFGSGSGYDLNAVEKEEMRQDVSKQEQKPEPPEVEAKAEPPKMEAKPEPVKVDVTDDISKRDLAGEIKSQGYTTIYVNFDVDKWTIRPESEPVINQVAGMLRDNPDLSLIIAGHTDSSGTWAHNKTLSENRAGAVVQALVARGIAAPRLASVGYGQDKPIADNATEQGKARNRRVELVKR